MMAPMALKHQRQEGEDGDLRTAAPPDRSDLPSESEVVNEAALLPIALAMPDKILRLSYPATCSSCGSELTKGTQATRPLRA